MRSDTNKTPTSLDDLIFIFDEIARIRSVLTAKQWDTFPRDFSFQLKPSLTDEHQIIIGEAGHEALLRIVRTAGKQVDLENRISDRQALIAFSEHFYKRYVNEGREINKKETDRLLAAIARSIKSAASFHTFFFPAFIISNSDDFSIGLGPTTIRSKRATTTRIKEILFSSEISKATEKDRMRRDDLARAVKHHRQMGWSIEVEIFAADYEKSKEIAQYTARRVLDIFASLFGFAIAARTRMHVGGRPDTRYFHLVLFESQEPSTNWGVSWNHLGHSLADGWPKWFASAPYPDLLPLLNKVIVAVSNPDLRRPLCLRIADAIGSYCIAARDDTVGGKLLNLVLALETLVNTNERGSGVRERFSSRVAALCVFYTAGDFSQRKEIAKKIYDVRSSIVHGRISRLDERLKQSLGDAIRVAEDAIFGFLLALNDTGLDQEILSDRKLKGLFDAFVDRAASRQSADTP